MVSVEANAVAFHAVSIPSLSTQIETIGDAYCVAGGLHKKVDSHAKPIAHMALKMMQLSEEVLTPDGKPIKVKCCYTCTSVTGRQAGRERGRQAEAGRQTDRRVHGHL